MCSQKEIQPTSKTTCRLLAFQSKGPPIGLHVHHAILSTIPCTSLDLVEPRTMSIS